MLIWFVILTDVFFSNSYWESLMLFKNFDQAMQDESARHSGNRKVLESVAFEVRKP